MVYFKNFLSDMLFSKYKGLKIFDFRYFSKYIYCIFVVSFYNLTNIVLHNCFVYILFQLNMYVCQNQFLI